jgi:DUF4097 and DUF4098 domain-containing protein YvlB
MIRKLIELVVLSILVVGLVLLLNQVGPVGADAKVALKYLWLGLVGIIGLGIVSITLIALAAIFIGIPFAKHVLTGNGFWSRKRHEKGAGIGEAVGGALNGLSGLSGLSGLGDLVNLNSRRVEVSVDKYAYDFFKLKTFNGDLEVCGQDLPGAKAEVEIMEKVEGDTEVFFEDGELKLKTKSGKKSMIGAAKIRLPGKLARLTVETVNGDISICDFATEGDTAFKGVNGDISVSGLKNGGEVSVKTVSGDVEIEESQFNSLTAQSISGDLSVKESAAATALLKTVSCDIDYSGSDIKSPTIKTVSGDVTK